MLKIEAELKFQKGKTEMVFCDGELTTIVIPTNLLVHIPRGVLRKMANDADAEVRKMSGVRKKSEKKAQKKPVLRKADPNKPVYAVVSK